MAVGCLSNTPPAQAFRVHCRGTQNALQPQAASHTFRLPTGRGNIGNDGFRTNDLVVCAV